MASLLDDGSLLDSFFELLLGNGDALSVNATVSKVASVRKASIRSAVRLAFEGFSASRSAIVGLDLAAFSVLLVIAWWAVGICNRGRCESLNTAVSSAGSSSADLDNWSSNGLLAAAASIDHVACADWFQ